MNDWILSCNKNKIVKSIEDIPDYENVVGFVYRITNISTGKFYIGKKSLNFSRKSLISKKEKLATGTRKRVKKVVKQSNWLIYWGSCKELTSEIKQNGYNNYKREII